jgi:hypothetical protein
MIVSFLHAHQPTAAELKRYLPVSGGAFQRPTKVRNSSLRLQQFRDLTFVGLRSLLDQSSRSQTMPNLHSVGVAITAPCHVPQRSRIDRINKASTSRRVW